MPNSRSPLVTGEYYHVFNRGIAHQPTFLSSRDYRQAILTLDYYHYNSPPVRLSRLKLLSHEQQSEILSGLVHTNQTQVEIVTFAFMPNHFHFLLRQVCENGITTFMSKLTNSYTKYLNTRLERTGPIFQGVFKSVHIETDEQLIHVSRYIHLNPVASYIIKADELFSYAYTSLPHYFENNLSFIKKEIILEHFPSKEHYRTFLLDQIDYARTLEQIKHLTLE